MVLYLNIADVKCDPLVKVDVHQVFPLEGQCFVISKLSWGDTLRRTLLFSFSLS